MSLSYLWSRGVPALALFSVVLTACGSPNSGSDLPEVVFDFTDPDNNNNACVQPAFPSAEPDLIVFAPPRFLLTTSQAQQSTSGQAIVRPGELIEAEITVNEATRRVIMELTDAWSPLVIHREELTTVGGRTEVLNFFPDNQNRGRYYMKLTLCADDCDDERVVFDIFECPDQPTEPCGTDAFYRRTVFTGVEAIREDATCVDLGGQPGVGSGSILIQ